MNQKLICGLTATLLLTTAAIGVTSSSNAESAQADSQNSEAERSAIRPSTTEAKPGEVVKVGEKQTPDSPKEESIAKIHSHELSGRKAATLYVRNIPVLTFVGPQRITSDDVKLGEVQADTTQAAKLKVGSVNTQNDSTPRPRQNSQNLPADPITRATSIAAKLNQLYRKGIDANSITVNWKQQKNGEQYVIEANKTTIVAVDPNTVLPDTTNNPEQDALQVTNRLRRIIGNASPLRAVRNKPARSNDQQISLGPIRFRVSGMASWYGPGFDGNMSASGEVFNQNAMTAAHRTLPFGTRVQVTNLDNGRAVIVRINDRGPYSGGRIIDLSSAAARALGVIQSGVAPVRLDVLGTRQATNVEN